MSPPSSKCLSALSLGLESPYSSTTREETPKIRAWRLPPVIIGDVIHERYRIVDKLGFGGYSTVWLAYDNISKQLLDEFTLKGPNGAHPFARALSAGVALVVAYLHSQGYVHGDIHLCNVLAKLPSAFDDLSIEQLYKKYGNPEVMPVTERNGKPLPPNVPPKAVHILPGDFAEAFSPESEVCRREDCHTPLEWRPDIWSLAATIWEIIGMKTIFSSDYATEGRGHKSEIEVLGPLPESWLERWEERGEFFDAAGCPIRGRRFGVISPNHSSRVCKNIVGREEEAAAILDLMRRMLNFRPEERLTAQEVLQSEWMVKWALPAFRQVGDGLEKAAEWLIN
ncbi:kinase-like domain-containing protein [Aspergillus aurantiobrunneus]